MSRMERRGVTTISAPLMLRF